MHALSFQDIDPAHHSIRCYEVFRDDRIAFEHKGQFCFGPRAKLSAFLSGSSESFFIGEAAEAKITELREQQGESRYHSRPHVSNENDELAATRKRWESDRASGQWGSPRTSAKS
jgi:hypothetical protein